MELARPQGEAVAATSAARLDAGYVARWLVGWGEWSSKDRVGSLGLATSGEPGASAPTLAGCCATRVIDCAYPSTLVCEICLNFILESLRACRCLAKVVAPRVCGFARRPRGCGVAQHVARPWGDGPPVCVALLVAPAGVASLSTWRGPGATVPPCGFARLPMVRVGIRQVYGCAAPSRAQTRSVLV